MIVECPVSIGELIDKMSILKIKTEKIVNEEKRQCAAKEYKILLTKLESLNLENWSVYYENIKKVNETLWEIEDKIRVKEGKKSFDEEFVELARNVYITNDKRFEIKNSINQFFGSEIKEVKDYRPY